MDDNLGASPVVSMQYPRTGFYLMIASAAGFALMGALVKVAGNAGVPVMQIIFVRAVVSLVISLFEAFHARVNPLGKRRGLLLARGLAGFLALICLYYAVVSLPFAEATVLQYTHPIFTAVLAFAFLRERPTSGTLGCILFSVFGLTVMLEPTWSQNPTALPVNGVIAGILSGFGSGVAYTLVRRLASEEHPAVIVLYFPLVCVPCTLILGWPQFVAPSPGIWIVLLGVGVCTQIGQVTLTRAMQRDSASRNTSLSYVQIVFAALLAVLLFDEVLSGSTIAGAVLILMGACINARLARPQKPPIPDRGPRQ